MLKFLEYLKARKFLHIIDDPQYRIMFLNSYNLFYVETPKAACTKIKSLLILLHQNTNDPKLADLLRNDPLLPHQKEKFGIMGGEDLSKTELWRICHTSGYFKFAFVRNPYDRLVSAYKDKIYSPKPKNLFYIGVARKIKSQFVEVQDPLSIDLNKTPVSFEEFIKYLLMQDIDHLDIHWKPQVKLIWYDHIHYDFIGHVENFEQDMRHVFNAVNAPNFIYYHLGGKINQSRVIAKQQAFWTKELADIVYERYKNDFETFGYDRRSYK